MTGCNIPCNVMLTFSFLKPKFFRKNVENNISRAIQRAKSENLSCPSCIQFCLTDSLILKTVLFLKLNMLDSQMFYLLSCRTVSLCISCALLFIISCVGMHCTYRTRHSRLKVKQQRYSFLG